MATPTNKKIRVSGHLEERPGANGKDTYYILLSWQEEKGKRRRRAKSTKLTVKGNLKRAEDLLADAIREQEALLDAVSEDSEQESLPEVDTPTAADALYSDFIEKDWLEAVRRGDRKAVKRKVRDTTFGGYQRNVQSGIVPYFKDKGFLLTELTADDINDFYDYHFDAGLSGTTIIKFHANIVSSLKYAARKDLIDSAERILKNVNRPEADEYLAKPYVEAEAMALIEAVRGHKLELAVILGAFYGLRRSEVVGLRWESIDFYSNTISVEHTVTVAKIDGKRKVVADDITKSKSSMRTLPLVPIFRALLLEMKAEQEHNRKLCGRSYNQEEGIYVYVDALGNRIKPDYISSEFPKFLEKNGLRRVRFHDMRHTSARLLLAAGIPIEAIQAWLGHSTIIITNKIYARFDSSVNQTSAKALTWMGKTSLALEAANQIQQQA